MPSIVGGLLSGAIYVPLALLTGPNAWRLVPGAWHRAPASCPLGPATWGLPPGAWACHLALGAWRLASRNRGQCPKIRRRSVDFGE